MVDPLVPLLADGVIEEVVARLKSGKEADLFLVRHGGQVVAAKVYKARQARNFRNNAAYKEGRQVRDTRMQRAMDRGSRFGQAAAEEAWKSKEADALYALHAAGVRVPSPVMFYQGVLLMEVVVDTQGHPAPRLVDAHVPREQAAALYADLRAQAVRMLTCDLIHGDLSPYNVLVGWNGPVVIDFPQVIGAAHNSQARSFFQRDLENLRRFFAHLDPSLHAASGDAHEIWRAYERRELRPDFVPSGRPAPTAPPPRSAPSAPARAAPPRHPDHGRPPAASAHRPPRRPEPPRAQGHRRREAPGPEVVRVSRMPVSGVHPAASTPASTAKAHPHASHAHASTTPAHLGPHAHAAPHPASPQRAAQEHGGSGGHGGQGHRRRRRRR